MDLAQIKEALKARYAGDGYALAFEVRNQTGYGSKVVRYADALCLGLWASYGHYLQGFEFKTSRADVLAELTNPEKAREIQQYCHFWWLVVGDAKLVSVDELPANWGLLVPNGVGIKIKKAAPLMQPEPLSYEFMGAMIRANQREASSDTAIASCIAAACRDATALEKAKNLELSSKIFALEAAIAAFEEASGLRISKWKNGQLGSAVKMLCDGGLIQAANRLAQMETELTRLLDNFKRVREEAQNLPGAFNG